MLYALRFFSSKCSLFHNASLCGSCIIHILYTGRAEIKKKIRRQRVNIKTNDVIYVSQTDNTCHKQKSERCQIILCASTEFDTAFLVGYALSLVSKVWTAQPNFPNQNRLPRMTTEHCLLTAQTVEARKHFCSGQIWVSRRYVLENTPYTFHSTQITTSKRTIQIIINT